MHLTIHELGKEVSEDVGSRNGTGLTRSPLLRGEVVHGLPRQDAVGLTEPSPYLTDSFM